MTVQSKLLSVIAPQGPSLVGLNWEYKKPLKINYSTTGAMTTVAINHRIMGLDNINSMNPIGISIPNIHI